MIASVISEHVAVEVAHRIPARGLERVADYRVTPQNIDEMAKRHKYPPDIASGPLCVVSGRSITGGKSQEHFVPEGLGYGWARLPKGYGTCDEVNETFGSYELEWLRFGVMGFFRPFYGIRPASTVVTA